MQEPTKNKVDFIPLFANGMTTNQILDYAKKNNAEIYLSDPETAKTQYKDAINPDQFDSFYSLAQEGYNNYRKGEWNGNVAESWMYRAPSVTLQRLGYGDAFIQPDKNMPVVEGRYGYDIEGNQVATPEEIADNLGYIINDKTGEKEPFSHGKVQSTLNIAKSVASIVEDFALPGMVNENMGNGKVVNGLYGDEIPYLAYNEEGLPEWRKAKKSDIKDTMLIRSAIGPQPMQRSYVSALIKNIYNIIPQIASTIGSVENTIDDLYDNMVYGKDMPGYLEAIGKQLQSTGTALSFKGSQRAQEGNIFNNKEALFSGLGQVLGQVLLQYATAGMAGAAGMGSSAAMWTANGVFGAMAMDSFAQQARHLGIPEEDIAWMGPIIGASEAFVEGIIGPNIITKGSDAIVHRNAMKEAIETETKKMIEVVGEKVPSNLSKSQKFQLARNISKAIGRIGETLYSEKTALGRLGMTSMEEGSEEIFSQFNQNLLQTLYDIDKNAHDPFVQPGEGMFGEVDRNNYSETFLNRIPDGMAESFVLGFLGGAGGALTSRQIFANHQEDTITDFIAKGKTDKLVDHMNSMYKKGELDVPFLDTDGNPIPVGSEGQVKSMNDLAYETLKNKIEVYDQLAKQYKITDSATLKAVGGDFSFLKNALFTAKEVNNARARLQEIQNNQQATEEEKAEIPVLQQTIVSGEQVIQNIVNPEHENTKYSKAYNDYLKTRRSLTDLAIKENNLDSLSKNPDRYFKALTASISDYSPDLYQNTRLFNSDALRAYNTAKTVEYEAKVKAREEARQNFINKVSSITSEVGNKKEILTSLNNRLSNIEAGDFEFAKADNDLMELDKRIFDIMEPLKMHRREFALKHITAAINDETELTDKELKRIGYTGLKVEDYKNIQDYLNDLIKTAEVTSALQKSIHERYNESTKDIKQPDLNTLFKSHFTDDVEKQYSIVEDAINRNLEGYNPSTVEKTISDSITTLQQRKQMLKVSNTTLQNLNKESGFDHISKDDRIVDDTEAKEINEKIESLIGKLTGLKDQVSTIAGQRSVRQQKLKQVHLEYVRRSLEIIISGKIANDFPKLKELYEKLVPMPKESMTMDSVLSGQDNKAIIENEKIINEIETIIRQNIGTIFSKEWYQGIIKTNFISNLKNSYQTLMGRSDYQGDYEQSFLRELSNNITASSIGYNYFVSYMSRLTGPVKNDITKARLDIYSKNPGENISSYEQEQAEESCLAHIAKHLKKIPDLSILQITIDTEIDYVKDKINNAINQKEKDQYASVLKSLEDNKKKYIYKSQYLRGEYKTGKTQHVLPMTFKLYAELYKERIDHIYVIGHTNFIRESLKNFLSNITITNEDKSTAGLIGNVITLSTTQAFKTDFGNSIVIWDEASLITNKHLELLKKRVENACTIFMGDNSQMQPVSSTFPWTAANTIANRTIPLLSKYSTDYPFITQLTNAFRDSRNGKNLEELLPMLFTEENKQTGELIGGHYYNSEEDIRNAFVQRMNDPTNTTHSQALVFLDNKQYNDWANQFKGKIGNENPAERFANNIFVLDYDVEKGTAIGMPESIQGNRVNEVYIADDIMYVTKLYPSNGNKNYLVSANAGYTAVGRALNYVAIKGPAAKNSTTKTWTDSNIKGETIEKEREQERTQRIEQLKGIYNKNYTQAPKSQIDNKEKKPDTKRGKGDIDKGEWKDLENTDFLTTAHKNGKSIVKVGDNFIDQKKIVHQVERFMTFQKDGSTSFFVVFDDGTKVDIKYLVDYDYVEDIDDEVTNRRSFKEQAQHVTDNVKAIWGTVYSVFMGTGANDTLNERERQKIRLFKSFIAPHINKYFRTNLYYMPEATMENRLGQPDSFKDVLMIKLDPIDDPQSRAFYSFLKNQSGKYGELLNEAISDILKNKLSEKYTHFMTLGDTEYDYADEKTGLPPVITGMDYDTQYEAIKKKILTWKKTDDIDYDTHQKNIQANLIKAQLRNIGAKKVKAGDKSMLGSVVLTTEKTNGRVVYDKTFTVATTVQDFIRENEKKGIRFNPEAEFGKLRDGSGTQVLKLYYSWSDKFDKNTYVVIRKPRMSTISKTKLSEWHSSDLEVVKNLDRNTDVNLLNEMLRGTHVYQWLKNNKSVIENRDEFAPIRELFSYVGKFIRMTGDNFNDEITSFRQLWKTIEEGYEGELGIAIQAHTDVPLLIAQNTRTTNINTDNNGDLITHAQEIHVPYSFVDVTSLVQPSEPTTHVVQEQESTLPVKKISRGIGRARNMVKGMSGNEQRIVREQAEDIIRKMLGNDFLEGRTEFLPFLQHGLLELYGLMENGTIKLELNEKGVEITSPRHEVFHVVFNYCLDEKMRVRLLNEAKEAMKSIPSYANGYITNETAEEWMARKFGEREIVPEHKTKSPWYTPSGLLQRFIDFIEGIYKRFMDSRSDIEKLFRSIENGKYSDMPANIYETGEDIERPNAKISDDSGLTSLLTTARENMNDAGEITTDVDMDEGIGNPNQVKMDYNYLHQLFGSMSDVHAMRRHYGYLINQNSIFNNSATFAISDYDQLIRDFEQYAVNESNKHHNQKMSNGKLMQDITAADIPELNEEEIYDYQDYITGRQDEEGRAMVYRTIVNSIFPDYTFPTKTGEKGTFGKYASDSIQLNWEQVDPDKSKSKLMRWQLEITPLHRYYKDEYGNMVRVKDANGRPETWDEQSFVNVPDLERSMKEAAATIRQRIINDPLDEWDYEYLFFDELRSIAERLGGNNPKSNNILSFLERFDSHESEEIDGEPQISLKDIRDEAYNNWQNDTQLERGLRISELINSIVSTNISLRQRHNTEMRISDTSFGKRYSLFKRSGNTHEEIKNDITTWVRNRVFTPGTSPVVKTSIRNALRGSDQYGKDKQYDISDKGLRFKNGNKFINLIEVKDGKVVFSDQINKTLLTGMVKFLGLKNLSKRTIEYMFDKSVKGSTPSDAIIEKLNDDMKFGFANYDGMSQDILAEGFLNMFRAIDDNITMTDALRTLQEKLEDKKVTQDAFDTDKAKILNKGNYTQEIDTYMQKYGMQVSGRDSQETMSMTQDAEAITNVKLPKPTDFYNLFNIIGAVEGYVRGNDYGKWSYRPDGSKWYNFAPSSHLFDVVGEGSKYLKERFKKRELEAIKGGLLKESVFYSEEGGRPHYYNALLDPGSTMELYKLWDYTGLKSSSVGSIKPSTKDFVTMGFQAFVDGIKSGNKVQTLYIPITHMASTGSQLNVIGEWTFDNTGTNKLIRVKVDENGQIESAILVDQMVNNEIVREFYARNRRAQVSRNKWCDFLQSGPWKSAFKNVTANLKPAAFEKAFNEAHKAFFASATEEQKKSFAINLGRSDLGDNGTDYALTWNKEKTTYTSLSLGKDTLFNDNPIYNRDNMDKIDKGDSKFTFTTELRDEIFEKEFKKYAAQLASHNFELPDDVASLLPNKQYYTLENNTDKSSRIVKYNPVAQAQFYAFHIANNALGPLTFGHENLFKDNTEKSKRSAPHNTGGDRSNTTSKYGWGKNVFTITVHDRIFKDPVTGKEIKTADGLSWGNILIKPFMKHAFGGDTFAPYGNTQQKDIYNNVNLITGRVDQHKESIDYTTSDLYRNSVMHREMTEIMIKHTDEMMQQVVPNWGFTLWDMFQQYYEESGPVGERDADKAAEKLHRWIIEESGYAEQIKNRLVWKMQNKSASKGSNSRINEYNPGSGITTGYVSKGVWTDDVKIVLNPYQDIQDDKRLALPTQILQYLGVGSQGNILKAMSIAGKLAKIYKIGKKAIDDEIENMKIDHNKLSQKDIYYSKLDAYMRKKGIDALDAQSGISNYAELITNPKITTDVPVLRQKLLQAYKNYVNKKCIKVPWRGLRMNQSTGEVFKIFEKGDQVYMLRDIEKMFGRELTSTDIAAGTIEVNGESYTIRDLKSMSHDGEKLNRGEVVMPVSLLRNFGIRQNETLVDVFTIRFMDGSTIDLRDHIGDDLPVIQNKIDRGMDDSYTEGTLTYTEDEKKGIIKLIDIEHSPSVRWMLNKNGDYIEDNTLAVYTGAIGRLLDVYANRVPANRLGSGAMSRVVGLVNDNGNNIYIPVGMTILNDSDFDIDQLSVYLNQLDESNMISESKDTITGLQNSIMTDIEGIYSDEGNKDNIFIASDIQNLRDLAQKTEDEQRQAAKKMEEKGNVSYNNNFTTDNMFATTIEDYDVTRSGNNAIGIIANTISGLAYMATLGPRISELAPGFKSFADRIFNKGQNSAHIQLGNFLQAALDNAKELILGRLGITQHAVNMLAIMTMDGKTNEEIADFFSKEPVVKKVFREVDRGDDVENSSREYTVLKVIAKERKKLVQGLIDKKNNSISIEEKKELQQEIMKYGVLTASEEAIYKSDVEESRKKFTELNKKAGGEFTRNHPLYREYEEAKKRYDVASGILSRHEKALKLRQLEQYALKAEALRRLVHFTQMRNGLQVLDFESENFYFNTQMFLGQKLPDYLAGLETDISRRMNYWMNNNDEYLFEKDPDVKAELYRTELEVQQMMDIGKVLRVYPQYQEYLTELQKQKTDNENMFIDDSVAIKTMAYTFLKAIEKTHWDFRSRRAAFYSAFNNVKLDHYFKMFYSGKKVNLGIPYISNDEYVGTQNTLLNELRLDNGNDREFFKAQFPQFVSFLQDVIATNKVEGMSMLRAWNKSYGEKEWKSIINNEFLNRLIIHGNAGMEYVIVSDSMGMTDTTMRLLSREFKKMPKDLQELFTVNELMNNSMEYRKGGISEIMGTDVYEDVSTALKDLKQKLAQSNESDKVFVKHLADNFMQYVAHENKVISYLKKEERDKSAQEGRRPLWIKSWSKVADRFMRQSIKKYNPNHPLAEKSDGYYTEYRVLSGRGMNFDRDLVPVTSIEAVHNFTVDELLKLRDKEPVTKQYYSGHDYHKLQSIDAVREETGEKIDVKPLQYYITQTGDIIRVDKMTPTEVVWVHAGVTFEQLQRNIAKQTKYRSEHDLTVKQEEVHTGRKEYSVTDKQNRGYNLDEDGRFDPTGLIMNDGMLLSDKYNAESTTDEVYNVWRLWGNENTELLYALRGAMEKRKTLYSANADEKSPVVMVARLLTEGYGMYSDTRNIQVQTEKASRALDMLADLEGSRLNAEAVQAIIGKIKVAVPGINIIEETSESVLEKGFTTKQRSWIDGYGFHINIDNFHSTTPVHEIGHIFTLIVKEKNPELYQQMYEEAERFIRNDDPIVRAIKRNYDLEGEAMVEEVINTIGGFYSREAMEQWLMGENVTEAVDNSRYMDNLWELTGNYAEKADGISKDVLVSSFVPTNSKQGVKEGVDFVFKQNPELANAVYETLGFENKLNYIISKHDTNDDVLIKDKITVTKELQSIKGNNFDGSINMDYEIIRERANEVNIGDVIDISDLTKPRTVTVNDILKRFTISNENKYLLEKLTPVLENIKIEYIAKNIFGNGVGMYSDKYNTIRLLDINSIPRYERPNISEQEVFFHELLHAATFRKISYFEENAKGLSKEELVALNELENIRKILKDYGKEPLISTKKKGFINNPLYGYTTDSIHEIISYAFTNEEFRGAIAEIPYTGNKSILDKLVELIANIFGVKQDTILNALLANAEVLLNNTQITPRQKQQVQQLYSQYLDTIFPDSKLKDIVYHGTDKEFENYVKTNSVNFDNFRHDAFYFTSDINDAKSGGTGNKEITRKRVISNIVNFKKPLILKVGKIYGNFERNILGLWDGENLIEDLSAKGFLNAIKKDDVDKYLTLGYDGIIIEEAERLGLKGKKNWQIVFKPEQIHILGSKQDIEGFKTYLKTIDALSQPIQSMTLQTVFNALTGLLLSNKTIVDLKDSDNQKIFYASLGKDPVSSIALTEKTPITNIKDFAGHFNNNASDTKNPEALKEEQFVNYLYDRIISSTRWNGKYHFEVGGQQFEWKENISEDELKKSIRDKVVPAYSERKAKLPGQTMQFINLLKEKKTVEEAGKIAFGENTYPLFILNQLANTLYANEKIIAVHRYSELRNHENKTLSEIYNPAFEGYDPLVFVHESNNGKLVVSLFDITPDPLGFSGIKRSGNHLLSPYISGAKYNELGGSYSNEDRDIRKVLLGMTVMAMRDKVPNMVVRNLSVVKFNKSKLENNPVSDVKELVHEIDIIRKQKPLMDAVDNPDIITILSNDKNYDPNIEQSFIQRLINNLSMSDNNENGGWVRKQYFDTLIKEGVTRQDIKRILVRMQKGLEEKYGAGTPALYNDNEYQVIGRALRELETGYIGWINSTKDMGTVGKYLINRHNVSNDVIQWIQGVIATAKQKVVEYVRNYQKDIHDLAQAVIREYELKHPEIIAKERTVNTGSDYFRHLYKTMEVKISSDLLTEEQKKNGITTETVIIPEIHHGKWIGDHWEFDDKQTEKLYREGKLNDTDLKYTERLLDVMEKRWKANIKHDNNNMLRNIQVDGKEGFNDGDTEKLFISHYRKGMVPVMSKEVAELMGKMSTAKIGIEKKLEQLANWDSLFSDNLGGDYKFDKLSNNMNSQLFNEQVWLGKMGLVRTANGYELFDRNRNKAASTNLSYTSDYFMMEGIRKEVYENEVIPEYNSAQAIFAMLENDPKDPQKQANNKEYLRIYFERAVHHKNQDPKETGIDTPFGKVYFKQAARSIQHLYGFLSLGFKPMIAIKSMVFNMTKLITEPMVVKLADLGINENSEKANKMPSLTDIAKALPASLPIYWKEFKKARELAYLFQLIDRQERDVLESRFTNLTEKRWLSEQFAYVGNWATDAWARMISMIAWMKNEGSWDAYSINKETGEIEYDETKDKRFYDESGKLKTANHEDVILQGLKERLIAQGTMKDGDTKLTRGHDYTLSDTTFKWFADKFIVGSMDDMSKVIAGTSYWGAFLTQFRLYSFDRLWTMGFNASTRESEWGAGFKAVQDEQGNWVSQKDRLVIEGMLQSYSKALKAIINVKNEGLGEWWGKQSAMRRMNIIRGAVQLALGAALLAMFKSWKDDKDGFDEKKLSWVISEIFFAIQVKDMLLNPIPLIQGVTDLWDMVAGRKNVEGLLRYTGPVGGMLDIEKQYENLKGETDDVKFDF